MRTSARFSAFVVCWLAGTWAAAAIELDVRSRKPLASQADQWEVVRNRVAWEGKQTAVIVCDVWDKHWCEGANRRLAAMLPRMNQTLKALREKGALIIHAPSDTMTFYEQFPQRAAARSAPAAQPPSPGRNWVNLDRAVEGPLPIDDSDGGCDCQPQCKAGRAWTRQHPAIDIGEADAISDNGQEVYNLLRQRGVRHVIVMGVHTNMCVLGRGFAIRQLVRWGFDVALMRDLTDTMYNSRRPPHVPHERGTELVVEHIEKHWCGSALSSDVLGDPRPKHIVFAIAEDEYDAKNTLPAFARAELEKLGYTCTFLHAPSKKDMPGIEALERADLLVLYLRRVTLPKEQLNWFKAYFDSGRPVVALRTSCHGFQNWLEFDRLVLGCQYGGHYGKPEPTKVTMLPGADHPLLRGVKGFASSSWLYKVQPLKEGTTPLLSGQFRTEPVEPVAWTNIHKTGKVFFTSLGHQDDFKIPEFRRLLLNAIHWGLEEPIPR